LRYAIVAKSERVIEQEVFF